MSASPRGLGDPRPLLCTFTTDSGVFTSSFDASDIAIFFVDMSNTQPYQGTGTWSNINANYAEYTPAVTDVLVTTAAIYSVYITINDIPFDAQIIEVCDPSRMVG